MTTMPADLLGWAATVVLIATLSRQIYKQHQAGSVEAVSTWLFVGQMTASVLFIAYSAVMGSTVFVVTNTLILITAVIGQILAFGAAGETSSRRDPASQFSRRGRNHVDFARALRKSSGRNRARSPRQP